MECSRLVMEKAIHRDQTLCTLTLPSEYINHLLSLRLILHVLMDCLYRYVFFFFSEIPFASRNHFFFSTIIRINTLRTVGTYYYTSACTIYEKNKKKEKGLWRTRRETWKNSDTSHLCDGINVHDDKDEEKFRVVQYHNANNCFFWKPILYTFYSINRQFLPRIYICPIRISFGGGRGNEYTRFRIRIK